jgi:Na+-translocating ferredoxin:NAD+ oxidoreductase RNF subunit RnfB
MNEILLSPAVLGSLGAALAGLLDVAAERFRVVESPLVAFVEDELPGVNCGNCGQPGCRAFAEQLVNSMDSSMYCPPGGPELSKVLAGMLGMEAVEREVPVAVVMCLGTSERAEHVGEYVGLTDCLAAVVVGGTSKLCPFGCVGFGSCVAACRFGGISINDGVAEVDEELCVGCGECASVCPLDLIELLPRERRVYAACKSLDPGRVARKICAVGCIGCRKCLKPCPEGAITCEATLAVIDPAACSACGACIETCPQDTIIGVRVVPTGVLAGLDEASGAGKAR